MRQIVSYLLLIAAMIGPAPLMGNSPQVEIRMEPRSCRLGDIVTLQAQMQTAAYAKFSLKIPKHDALYLVAQNELPITYHQGVYLQQSIWTFQPTQPGQIELNGILAQIQIGSQTMEQTLNAPLLVVEAYTEPVDSMTPLLLDEASESPTVASKPIWSILVAIAVLWLAGIIWRATRKSETNLTNSPSPRSLAELQIALRADQVPQALIEALLIDPELELSARMRSALERAAYGKPDAATFEALRNCIREETQS